MALEQVTANLLFTNNKQYGTGQIKFDLLLSETHNMETRVSDHPIEDGSIVSDHLTNALESGSVTGLISNYSIRSTPIVSDRTKDVYNALKALWKSKQLVTIYTMMEIYENVIITNMPITRDAESSNSIVIQLVFKKVNVVKLQVVELDTDIRVKKLDSKRRRRAAKKKSTGRQTTSPPRNPNSTVTRPIVTG